MGMACKGNFMLPLKHKGLGKIIEMSSQGISGHRKHNGALLGGGHACLVDLQKRIRTPNFPAQP